MKPGMYLCLLHGFKSEEEREFAACQGVPGPKIGPLKEARTVYAGRILVTFESYDDARMFGFDSADSFNEIEINDNGCVVWGGMEYGDYTLIVKRGEAW